MANRAVAVPLESLQTAAKSADSSAQAGNSIGDGTTQNSDAVGWTPDIETTHVREVYDRISDHWSRTRYKPWPRVLEFLASVPKHGLLADVGCGNGKYLQPALDCGTGFVVGLDASLPLLELALQKMYDDKGYDRPWERRGETVAAGVKRDVNGNTKTDLPAESAVATDSTVMPPSPPKRSMNEKKEEQEANEFTSSSAATSTSSSAPVVSVSKAVISPSESTTPSSSASAAISTSAVGSAPPTENTTQSSDAAPMCDAAGADIVRLAMRSQSVDGVVCIAVLHHLSTTARRTHAVREMARVLVPGGRMLVYAWAKEQEENSRRKFPSQDVFVPWQFRAHGKSYMKSDGGEYVVQRYCHVYVEGELEGLVDAAGGLVVDKSYYDKGNWCVIARKL